MGLNGSVESAFAKKVKCTGDDNYFFSSSRRLFKLFSALNGIAVAQKSPNFNCFKFQISIFHQFSLFSFIASATVCGLRDENENQFYKQQKQIMRKSSQTQLSLFPMPLQKIIRLKTFFTPLRAERNSLRKDSSVNVFFVVSSFAVLCNLFLLFSVLNFNSVCYRRCFFCISTSFFAVLELFCFLLAPLEMRIQDSSSFTYDNIS